MTDPEEAQQGFRITSSEAASGRNAVIGQFIKAGSDVYDQELTVVLGLDLRADLALVYLAPEPGLSPLS